MVDFKRIVLINGRGNEGCGATRHAIEYKKFFEENNIACDVYCSTDRDFNRGFSQIEDTLGWINFQFANNELCEKYVNEILENKPDLVIYIGLPAKQKSVAKGNDKIVVDNFYDYFVDMICGKITTMYLCTDHSIHSIIRNARWEELASKVDMWGVHGLNNDFVRKALKEGIKHKPTLLTPATFNFDEVKSQFWKNVEDKTDKTYGFIGRSAHWKGPELVYKIHENGLRKAGFITTLEGMELSIGALGLFFNNSNRNDGVRTDMLDCTNPKKSKYTLDNVHTASNEPAILFGPYKRVDALNRISLKKFGSNLFNLHERQYGIIMECAHCEIICSGTIPIFHRHHGANTINVLTNKPHYDVNLSLFDNLRNTGTIWVDDTNIDEVVNLMLQIDNDNMLYDQIRNIAYDYWKGCYDRSVIFNKLLKDVSDVIECMDK